MFVHVVFFRGLSEPDAQEAAVRLEGMMGQVASLRSIEVGCDQLHTDRSWDMVLITRFDNQLGYESYSKDPKHQEVVRWLKPRVSASATVDYVTTN